MCKKARFRTPFHSQLVQGYQTLVKSAWQYLYPFTWPLLEKLSWKTSLLVISKILGLFANTLTVPCKDFLHNWKYISKPIQVQLSKKPTFFCKFFTVYL